MESRSAEFRSELDLVIVGIKQISPYCYGFSFFSNSCISDYKLLGVLKRQFPDVPVIGLTATASASVLEDVKGLLNLHACVILRSSYNRANLFYQVLLAAQPLRAGTSAYHCADDCAMPGSLQIRATLLGLQNSTQRALFCFSFPSVPPACKPSLILLSFRCDFVIT